MNHKIHSGLAFALVFAVGLAATMYIITSLDGTEFVASYSPAMVVLPVE